MRLNCANCGAEYEVGDEAIPAGGREVQCSACGYRWHAEHQPDLPLPMPDAVEPPAAADQPAPEGLHAGFGDDGLTPQGPRRPVDPAALAILREEAAREVRARNAEAGVLEFQPELGLEPVVRDAAIAGAMPVSPDRVIGWLAPAQPDDPEFASIRSRADLLAEDLSAAAMVGVARSFEDRGLPKSAKEAMLAADQIAVGVTSPPPVDAGAPPSTSAEGDAGAPMPPSAEGIAGPDRGFPEPSPQPAAEPTGGKGTARPNPSPQQSQPATGRIDAGTATDRPSDTQTSATDRPAGRGFAIGFVISLCLGGLLAVLYLKADQLAQDAPAAAPYLHDYANGVDQLRDWLDQKIGGVTGR